MAKKQPVHYWAPSLSRKVEKWPDDPFANLCGTGGEMGSGSDSTRFTANVEDVTCEACKQKLSGGDPVNSPSHYTQGKVECIDAIESAVIGLTGTDAFATGQAIKYLWRWKKKGGVEDLKKAKWYLDRLILSQPKEE